MPLLIGPYTFGSEMAGAGVAPVGGAAYYLRRRRYTAYLFASLVLLLIC